MKSQFSLNTHPRIILTNQRLDELKQLMQTDSQLRHYADDIIKLADKEFNEPPLKRVMIGKRLLKTSRRFLNRVYSLGIAWRLTGDKKYAEEMKKNMLAVCDFNNWNPPHFLDTAEAMHAMALGYDWLYDYLDPDTKRLVCDNIIEKGIKPGLYAYSENKGWTTNPYNWNLVCNGGLAIASLAIADEYPLYAENIIPLVIKNIPLAVKTYEPDGVWPEGISYWNYASNYLVYALTSMNTSLGTDFGISNNPGLAKAGDYCLYTAGPTGMAFCYADVKELSYLSSRPTLFWFAKRYNKPQYSWLQQQLLKEENSAGPMDFICYYAPPESKITPRLELDKYFKSSVEIAYFRSGFDPNALFIAVKAGFNRVSHGHLDLGQFELDALGKRWFFDIGADNYDLPDYFTGKTNSGQRWTYYRLNSLGHSVVLIDRQNQDVNAVATVEKFQTGENPFAVIDIKNAFAKAKSLKRKISLTDSRSAVLVEDFIDMNQPGRIEWQTFTKADIEIIGSKAVLTMNDKKLYVKILSPADAVFGKDSAAQQPPQNTNDGINRLFVKFNARKGKNNIAVRISVK